MMTARTTEVITKLTQLVAEHYVFPEIAHEVNARVTSRAAEGAYAGLDDEALAAAVTKDLQSVNGDKHLRLKYHPDELPEQLEDDEVHLAHLREWANSTSNGIATTQRLPGNVGLLRIEPMIFPGVLAGDAYAAAMTLLSTTDALLLDLRGCRGGEPGMTAVLVSYLFGNEPVELVGIYERRTNRVKQNWTVAHVAGPKFGPDKPVYVLTSNATFSGGEAVAHDLQETGRAIIVGEQTGGGAHPREGYTMGSHLEATIPTGRSVSPVTGGNWEGTGITPDIKTDAASAQDVALRLAQEKLNRFHDHAGTNGPVR